MIQVGRWNSLKIHRQADFGVFLDAGVESSDSGDLRSTEILLPTRYVPADKNVGDIIDVFLYHDSEDRLIATTEKPKAQVGEMSFLTVVDISDNGAFLDWGLLKDLFLPFAEQVFEPEIGKKVIVALYLDKSGRISASMRLEKHLLKTPVDFSPEQEVDLLIYDKTDLGYKALINGQHYGMIYKNEVFQALRYGQVLKGYIKQIRDDGKIDLRLDRSGHKAAQDGIEPLILEELHQNNGFLAINDKTPAEKIYELFGVSKKKYKVALGSLYKKRLIRIEENGIYLVK